MAVREEGSNIIVNGSIAGSLFPKNEKDIIFPVLIDGSKSAEPILIEGSVYGRSVEVRGGVTINGPVVSRGDTKLSPSDKKIRLNGGITVNGVLNGSSAYKSNEISLTQDIENASIIIRGDIAVNQSLYLSNAIVFGSIKAVNCKLENCIILGTLMIEEQLTVSMSSIGGYSAREVTFEGNCILIHALGESLAKPVFSPYESISGEIIESDVRYYPAMRENSRLVNLTHANYIYPQYSQLNPFSDWVLVHAHPSANDTNQEDAGTRVVLSIGGRIGDFSQIKDSLGALTDMLKCGFEYDHLSPHIKLKVKEHTMSKLNQDEGWILNQVCP
jgi:cytoskeletal protein CcmA (bactofilin family)